MIFNTHSHINDKDINEANELVNICLQDNVDKIAVVGYDYASSLRALNLAKENKHVYAICGLQPGGVDEFDGDFSKFIELFNCKLCAYCLNL